MAVPAPYQPEFIERLIDLSAYFTPAVNSTWQFACQPHEVVKNGVVESGTFTVTNLHEARDADATITFDVTFETSRASSHSRVMSMGKPLRSYRKDNWTPVSCVHFTSSSVCF